MKRLLILFLLACSSHALLSQDLIVTNENDTINCRITKIKGDNIYFTFKHKEEIRNTLLPKSKVKFHQYDYYQSSEVPESEVVGYQNYPKLRIAFNGGFSQQTAKISSRVPAVFRDYIRELKSGSHYGGDMIYYVTEPMGFGFKYFVYNTSNSLDNIFLEDINGNRRYGRLSDDLTVTFIGPTFSSRLLNKNKSNAFIANFAIGYMGYDNDIEVVDPYNMSGSTVGLAFELGYDIGISDNLALGIQVSYLSGALFEYDLSDGTTTTKVELEQGQYESLNRIDFSIGLRFTN